MDPSYQRNEGNGSFLPDKRRQWILLTRETKAIDPSCQKYGSNGSSCQKYGSNGSLLPEIWRQWSPLARNIAAMDLSCQKNESNGSLLPEK
ncbi:hypothetical protein CDAR_110091 [Caerostris darwini]|uniref:Uncharacterized protein n=1 Tax=Caerostris darwini TaxID=1538125 RepID=A0AAV4W3U6_9ARAC|nr:hypothetical protein CDAR_110091 [Caerostris darwini]